MCAERADLPIPRLSSREETGAARSAALKSVQCADSLKPPASERKKGYRPGGYFKTWEFLKDSSSRKDRGGETMTSKQTAKC